MKETQVYLMGQPIPNEVMDIAHCFTHSGYKLWLVGGCIRDVLLFKEPHDWDMCTDATPDEIIRIAGEAGMMTIPTGIKHGTVTVVLNDQQFEITTCRKDGNYSDGRRPDEVVFTNSIKEDLARRDFTINAIAFDIGRAYWHTERQEKYGLYSLDEYEYYNNLFIDPYGGQSDILEKTIRCVDNPYDRFNEDALRILRALRFSAQLGFEIDNLTSADIHDCKHLLGNISKERIRDELCKILLSNGCGIDVLMEYQDVFVQIMPDVYKMKDVDKIFCYIEPMMLSLNNYDIEKDNKIILRLYMLLHLFECNDYYRYQAPETYKILKHLKFSNDIVAKTTQLVSYRNIPVYDDKPSIKRLLNKIGSKQFNNLAALQACKTAGQFANSFEMTVNALEMKSDIMANNECYSLKQLAINGDYLINFGVPQGEQIKHVLNILLNLVIDEHVENDKDKLLGVVRSIIYADTPLTKEQ